MGATIGLIFHPYSGFHYERSAYYPTRLTLGFISLIWFHRDLDDEFRTLCQCHDEHYHDLLFAWKQIVELEDILG